MQMVPASQAVELNGVRMGKTERVYEQLKHDIQNGTFRPGQILPEVMLVEHTGMSRTPVREALRRLAADGLVEIQPRRAPMVTRLSLAGARALFDFRRILEPAAMREVVGRATREPRIGHLFAGIAADFEDLSIQEYSEAFADRFSELTARFDDNVVELTPNEYLSQAIHELRPHTARLRHIAHQDIGRLSESIREHIEMCRAIESGDAERAAAACTHHLFHVDQAIFNALLASSRMDQAIVDL
ncbi:hypothetical protein BIU90_10785 [Curtobacterium sp. MCBA15_001]|nr:hypothetical protein BIU90_10785 [Curtobacterium sp. MCBA15_001]